MDEDPVTTAELIVETEAARAHLEQLQAEADQLAERARRALGPFWPGSR